jgi:N-acetylated-alpha-linked acidic dipeptidase
MWGRPPACGGLAGRLGQLRKSRAGGPAQAKGLPHSWIILLAAAALAQTPTAPPIRGFPVDSWKSQRELEEKARSLPQAERFHIYMERMAAKPHHAGSAGSKAVADYAAGLLKEWGYETRTEKFEAMIPYPGARVLETPSFKAALKEPIVPGDVSTADNTQIPSFNAYSAAADVTAPLVYANYGMPEDFDYLDRQGISLKGKIAIVRYGRNYRGAKPKLAAERGAVGCLIYSDPRDDGYFINDVYPNGPMRPAQGVQRGSVLDMPLYPGDPLSPGWASESGSKRLTREEAKSILKIPVLPISWGDAKPLLEQIGGSVAPEDWRGALPITYHIGPGTVPVHLKLDFEWANRPLYDVIATMPGSVYKDQWVVFGNHHDAWVNGATDPISGASALLETARVLSELRKQGWRPKRTIVFALWDGEEFGLMGSTEWAEKHLNEIERKAVVYINSDSTGQGSFSAAGSLTLESFLKEVMRDTTAPGGGRSLLDAALAANNSQKGKNPKQATERPDFQLGALGAGSDYVAFLDHAGVASLNVGFGADAGGVYHSAYDTVAWYDRFSDTDRSHAKALSQFTTTAILRLAGAPVLPFEFEGFSRAVNGYVDEIRRAQRRRPGLDLGDVQAQLTRISVASKTYEDALAALGRQSPAPAKLGKANETIGRTERALLLPDGLPGREWYRHQIYAPGLYTGYGVKTLPGIREAVEGRRTDEANQQAKRVAQVLRSLAMQVEESARLLKQAADQ